MNTATVPSNPEQANHTHDTTTTTTAENVLSSMATTMVAEPSSTARAPVVGPSRKKANSLVGFDPLLTPTSASTTDNNNTSMDHPLHSMAGVPSIPPLFAATDNNNDDEETKPDEMVNEKTADALDQLLEKAVADSPNRKNKSKSLFRKNPKQQHRKTQSLTMGILSSINTNKDDKQSDKEQEEQHSRKESTSLSPPRPVRRVSSVASAASPFKNLPWSKRGNKPQKGHRQTKSISAVPNLPLSPFQPAKQSLSATTSPVVNKVDEQQLATMSPMIQELLQLDTTSKAENGSTEETNHPLLLPSFAPKPMATSFLTGQQGEVVRSSEQDATPWQLEIPSHSDILTGARLCQFLEIYAAEECLLDWNQLIGVSRLELKQFACGDATHHPIAECHRPIVEAFLECGSDISEVKGFFTNAEHAPPDARREVLVVERQNKFLCVFRGTAAEQQGKFAKQSQLVPLQDGSDTNVFVDRLKAFSELQEPTFQLLDKLTEDNPFCDIKFTGHAFGAALATLAAYSYANTRTALRVGCTVSAAPKIGQGDFRWAVHSSPNLNMWRVEYATGRLGNLLRDHTFGHCLRLSPPSKDSKYPTVKAYKFGSDGSVEKQSAAMVRTILSPAKNLAKEKHVTDYVSLLEELDEGQWVKDYYHEDGAGVRGKDNEARQMA